MSYLNNLFLTVLSFLALFLNKIRYALFGYTNPRRFSTSQIERAIDYDIGIVNNWLHYLDLYAADKLNFKDKNILELGPGGDLGIGVIMLCEGAESYTAIDVNNLIEFAPESLYSKLFDTLSSRSIPASVIDKVKDEYSKFKQKKVSSLKFICDELFDLSVMRNNHIDFVLSNAAFEHFTDIESVMRGLSDAVPSGCILVTEVDLSTHTRWLRDCDPLNIYRLNDTLYSLLKYSGIPNRVRPYEYMDYLKKYGWENVKCYPKTILDDNYVSSVKPHLYKKFRSDINEMQNLHVVICAIKS